MSLAFLVMGTTYTSESQSDNGPEPMYPLDVTIIEGRAIFMETPEVKMNGFVVRCKCGNAPYVVKLNYGVVDAYCDDCAPIEKRSSYFSWDIFPWGNKEE